MAGRVYEFTEYLVDQLGMTELGAHWDGMLAYHSSCHTLRGMWIDRQPRTLLANVRGAQVVDLPHAEECCGFGGIFSMEHPELSAEWLKRKISNLETTRSPTLVVTDAGCLMHIAGGLHRQKKPQQVLHIAEILNHHEPGEQHVFRLSKHVMTFPVPRERTMLKEYLGAASTSA